MQRVIIALGSNLADPLEAVRLGWRCAAFSLALEGGRLSRILRTLPAEDARGPSFANAVGVGYTNCDPLQVLAALQRVERSFGRDRSREGHHGSRPLDLDLIDYGGQVLDLPSLVLPHPRLAARDFVLVPLSEVARDFTDARTGLTVTDLLRAIASTQRHVVPSTGEDGGHASTT